MRQLFPPKSRFVLFVLSLSFSFGVSNLRAQSGVSGLDRQDRQSPPSALGLTESRREAREALRERALWAASVAADDARAAADEGDADAARASSAVTPDALRLGLWPRYDWRGYRGFYAGVGGPFFALPGTAWPGTTYKGYGPPVALEPQLGLQHIYRYGWQMGIQMPEDLSPIHTYSLGPYVGVVRSPQYPAWLRDFAPDVRAIAADPSTVLALALLQEGSYRDAGRLLAESYRETKDPAQGILLVEALAALGKTSYAERLFRQVLEREDAVNSLPRDPRLHFRTDPESAKEAYEKVRSALEGSADAPLLSAYLQLFGETPEDGLDTLARLADDSGDAQAKLLYEHYLHRVFGDPEEESGEEESAGEGTEDTSTERPRVPAPPVGSSRDGAI